jgi:transcriptional regulator with XRE-family HTH domain
MEVSEEKFAQLIKKATSINDGITQKIADGLKVTLGTLGHWVSGESMPQADMRMAILQRVTAIMLGTLGEIANKLEETSD